jgi:hypothetical protein
MVRATTYCTSIPATAPTLRPSAPASPHQLWFAQAGQDLVMSVIGRPQTLTLAGWYDGAASHLGEVDTADGYRIADRGIEQLVQAMAVYQPPASGQTTLPPELASDLAPVLASTWQHT